VMDRSPRELFGRGDQGFFWACRLLLRIRG
jgi:hypothetical protein